ncbi:MAG: gamma-glutamyl-gamma-aminobutyrate hydrolase family protein [Bdellovibrionales bacterium]|nr:gamma-glutamyl-gamma-aminobutyrate hydrolase family protein [Bdellovibrionales bacterium]
MRHTKEIERPNEYATTIDWNANAPYKIKMLSANKDHIVVIDPAVRTPELDCFNHLALTSPLPLSYHLPALHGMATLETEGVGAKGVIVLGSSSSVLENRDWQVSLGRWLKQRSGVPMLGICFGHQLFAHLYGGVVDFMYTDNRKLSGFREVTFTASRVWPAQKGRLTVTHREAVLGCPPEMEVIASSPEVAIEGLAHKTLPIWTLQAHPEATPAFLRNMHIPAPERGDALDFGWSLIRSFLQYCAKA